MEDNGLRISDIRLKTRKFIFAKSGGKCSVCCNPAVSLFLAPKTNYGPLAVCEVCKEKLEKNAPKPRSTTGVNLLPGGFGTGKRR